MKSQKTLQIIGFLLFPAIVFAQSTVTVNFETPMPLTAYAGSDVTITSGESVTLGANPIATGNSGTLTYAWTPTEGLSNPELANPVATPTQTTTYTLTITDVTGCSTTDNVIVTVNSFSAIDEVLNSGNQLISVFPNPSNGRFQIRSDFSHLHGKSTVSVVNLIGSVLYTKTLDENNESLLFDVSFLSKGLYCLKFSNGNHSEVIKFTIN